MAIYYIDPNTTVSGTGSFASPWSFASSVRTGLTSGDEIRILSKYLTDILTPTLYTATYGTGQNNISITSGGGGGADFPIGTIAYFPDFDVFHVVTGVSGATVTFGLTPILPDFSTSAVFNVRIVDKTVATAGATSTAGYLLSGAVDNITVSDGWIDATTQVTDGSAKTLLWSSTTSANFTFYITGSTFFNYGLVANLQNTHILHSLTASSSNTILAVYGSNITASINQINAQTSSGGTQAIGLSTAASSNVNLTIKTARTYYPANFGVDGANVNITVTNYLAYTNSIIAYTNLFSQASVTITNLYIYSNTGSLINFNNQYCPINLTVTNKFYYWLSYTSFTAVANGYPTIVRSLTLSEGIAIRTNRETTTPSTVFTYFVRPDAGTGIRIVPKTSTVKLSIPSAWTYNTSYYYTNTQLSSLVGGPRRNTPVVATIVVPVMPSVINYLGEGSSSFRPSLSILYTDEAGGNPVEVLAIQNCYPATSGSILYTPYVTTDAAVFRTTGPSLKFNLVTWGSNNWNKNSGDPCSLKSIKVPCVAGVSYTVSGYINTSITSYANGDIKAYIALNDEIITSQDITTASAGAWEQFSLTFTAAITGEYELIIRAYFINSGSFWLDDLTIA